MRILVIGGTGTVGTEVVKRLVALGEDVSVMTHTEGAGHGGGSRLVRADLDDAATVRAAMSPADAVFLLLPQSRNETERGLTALGSARTTGVQRLVYMSVRMPAFAPEVPHFASKQRIEQAVQVSGIPYTILRPNNFFQNDLAFTDTIVRHWIYPQPIGSVGLARVDVRDIADVAVLALTRAGHEGQVYDVNGPATLTGPSCAAIYGRVLGREVRYAGDSLEAWAGNVRAALPAWLISDLLVMYERFQQYGMASSADADARLEELLGRRPRSFEVFAAELAAAATPWGRDRSP